MRKTSLVAGAVVALLVASAPHADAAKPVRGGAACRNGYVSLSFDDGPTPTTPQLLTALRRNNLKATFFDTGEHAEQYPAHVVATRAEGHDMANHSYNHAHFGAIGDDAALSQLAFTNTILAASGPAPAFYRPPYGETNPTLAARAKAELGLTEIIWTVDTNDWDGRSADAIARTVSTARGGDFVLMHDGPANTIAALPKIAAALDKNGLCAGRIVTSTKTHAVWEGLSFTGDVARW